MYLILGDNRVPQSGETLHWKDTTASVGKNRRKTSGT